MHQQPVTPISARKLASNRANAARSTGPRTPEGKARSACNATKHGFTSSSFAVVRLEDLDEVARLKDDLLAVYQPENPQEVFAIERLALAQHNLFRIARLEAGLMTQALNEALNNAGEPFIPMSEDLIPGDLPVVQAQNRNFALACGFARMAQRSNVWTLFLRYQAQAERHYRRAVEDLERLRSLRPTLPPELPIEPTAEPDPKPSAPSAPSAPDPDHGPTAPPDPLGRPSHQNSALPPRPGVSAVSGMPEPPEAAEPPSTPSSAQIAARPS